MPTSLIPALDPAPLPGPPWLFHVLWVVTFFIHVVFVNVVLGGSLLAVLPGAGKPGRREATALFVNVNSWAISFAITFGVAPLLFMQVVLGRFFYSATILLAWPWFAMLALLLVGYYCNYIAKFRLRAGRQAGAVLLIEAGCFLAVAATQIVVNLLHMQPGRWEAVADNAPTALADPTFLPRFLHFVLAGVAMAGAMAAWVAVRRGGSGDKAATNAAMARFGIRAALVATLLQLVDGFWLLLALPEGILKSYMRGGALTMVPLTTGILAGVLLLMLLAQITDPLAHAVKVRRVLELIVAAVLVMVISRHQLRGFYLAAARADEQVAVAPQWGVFALFLALFVAGMAVTIYAMVKAATDRPATGEPAA